MRLRVVSVFGLATLEDEGRPGFRRFGVPAGGAFDTESFHSANAALGSEPGAVVIEFALGTLELETVDSGSVAIVGAAASVTLQGVEKGANACITCNAGDRIMVHPPARGLRTYIAVPGGFDCDLVLDSASGTPVENGMTLKSKEDRVCDTSTIAAPTSLIPRALRVFPIGDEAWMTADYKVSRNINRVGLRLDGPRPMTDARSGRSEPSVFGAVQLTEDRTLIIHGPDGPTIGGYKKMGCVVRQDLDRLGQLAPGDEVRFTTA